MPTIPQLTPLTESLSLPQLMPAVRRLPALDKLRLIRILAEELELAKEIFPFEAGQTYDLPTPYDSFGAAEMLAEALATYQAKDCQSA